MVKKSVKIAICVVAAAAVAAGLGVLIWWLVTRNNDQVSVIRLEGEGIGELEYTAAITRIPNIGDMFWWFYPTTAAGNSENHPIVLWVGGAIGMAPSLLANLAMIGPYDLNFNRRNNSWIDRYNLLFIDAPLGTGFSTPVNNQQIPKNIDENAKHLATTLDSFFSAHPKYVNTSIYIFGQAHGAQLALALAIKLNQDKIDSNIRGVVLGNAIISPALAMTKLGFYLEELAYIDDKGRAAIEALSSNTTAAVASGDLERAFNNFMSLGEFVNNNAGAVAVNLDHIVEKQTRNSSRDYFGEQEYLHSVFKNANSNFMDNVVGPALGVPSNVKYDPSRNDVIAAFRTSFMAPAKDKVEYLLQNTEITVSIYNGNLDAVSNTPGQLEWIDNLQWPGQAEYRNSSRQTLVINRVVEGYFRETKKLKFYWVNAAGQSAPINSPTAMNSIVSRIIVNE